MSNILEALAKADRERKAKAQARELLRVAVPAEGDTPTAIERWIEEGPAFVQAFAALAAERDRLRARAEAAERECGQLRERHRDRPWLGSLAYRSIGTGLAATVGIAVMLGGAWLYRERLASEGQRHELVRPIAGESTARADVSARTHAEPANGRADPLVADPDGGRAGRLAKGADTRGTAASTDRITQGTQPRPLQDAPSAKRANPWHGRRPNVPSSPRESTGATRATAAAGTATAQLHDAGAI